MAAWACAKMEVMMDAKDAQSIDAARLYYAAGMAQAEVAAELGVSRPTVSKLLAHAHAKGYVTISIHDPREEADEVIDKLCAMYGLQAVRVVRPATHEVAELRNELGAAAADMLEGLWEDGMSVGISWGRTLSAVAEHLRPQDRAGMTVVQLKGGHSHSATNTNDMATLTRFARALGAEMKMLPLPVIFDSAQAKEMVVRDRHIASLLKAGAETDLAVFTVGDVRPEGLLLNLGYLSDDEVARLTRKAVGDVCSRFYTATGQLADAEIDARTVGISVKDLTARPIRVLVAGGPSKATAIRVALEMGLATHLVIDRATALRVLGDEGAGGVGGAGEAGHEG